MRLLKSLVAQFMSLKNEVVALERRLDVLLRIVVGAFFCVFLIYILLRADALPGIPIEWFRADSPSPATLGTFGDFVGGTLNPLVSLFAFYLLSKSIRIQQKEFAKTNEALEASHLAQLEQSKTLEIQRFDHTFFSLLDQHNEVLRELNAHAGTELNEYTKLGLIYSNAFEETSANMARIRLQSSPTSGHYFRILYQILKYIAVKCPETSLVGDFSVDSLANNTASQTEKFYSNLVRAFLDTRILQLLAANCHINSQGVGYLEYRGLIERYAMLEHMPFKLLGNAQKSRILYEAAASYTIRSFGQSQFLTDEIAEQLWSRG